MVSINKIYTRTGDDGSTGLVGGERIAKTSARVRAYGEVDELNSFIGAARTEFIDRKNLGPTNSGELNLLENALERVQHQLFDIGAELACPNGQIFAGMTPFPSEAASELEALIDAASEGVPALKSFVLPGGSRANAALHIARAVCRRVEREVLALSQNEPVSAAILIYLNRLSDFLFALARRLIHDEKKPEFLWAQKK